MRGRGAWALVRTRSWRGCTPRTRRRASHEFSSRLDGSAPSFGAWSSYIDYRLGQIRGRGEATEAVDTHVLDQACDVATALAAEVNDSAEAVLCHRDLHPGNLIVDDHGTLVGIIDWDAAESWDRAGDWFKLEYELLQAHLDSEGLLLAAYLRDDELPPQWSERRRLVHIIETLNILPNALSEGWATDFTERARTHLDHVLFRAR